MVIQSDFTVPWNSVIFQLYQADFQLSICITGKAECTFQNKSNMSDNLSFGSIIRNSKVESFVMSNYAGINRNDIYGGSYDSGMKNESFPKISEKSLNANIMNFGYYVGNLNFYQWLAR